MPILPLHLMITILVILVVYSAVLKTLMGVKKRRSEKAALLTWIVAMTVFVVSVLTAIRALNGLTRP